MYARPTPPPKHRRLRKKHIILSGVVILIAASYITIALTRPFAELNPNITRNEFNITTSAGNLPWPSYGQSAFGLVDGSIIDSRGDQTPIATASAAKLITALVILDKKPLTAASDGPIITLDDADVNLYRQYVAQHGSVIPVVAGQKITERDALEALLLPSANNIADSLALWAFGDLQAYITYANSYVANHGIKTTHIGGDASGFSPETTSTATDLVRLGALSMQNPVISQIVAQKSATVNGVGTVRNVNSILGNNGIVGIKTGNNDQDPGIFVGASNLVSNGRTITIITTIAGASSLNQALHDSDSLIAAIRSTFTNTTVVQKGAVVGSYRQPDGRTIQAVVSREVSVQLLRGSTVRCNVDLKAISYNVKQGQTVGYVIVPATHFAAAQKVPVVLAAAPTRPTIQYQLLHP